MALSVLRVLSSTKVQKVRSLHSSSVKRFSTELDATNVRIEKNPNPPKMSPPQQLVFGKEFSAHMLEVDWNRETGWGQPQIVPFRPITLYPSASVFHYGTCLFEGLKAYKDSQGKIRLFRPDKNVERINNSAQRLVFPTVNKESFISLIGKLLKEDAAYIPQLRGYSLYLRPTMIGTQPSLGVAPSSTVKLFVVASPVGPYYPEGWKPVKLMASDNFVRAWPGGTGAAKMGANYAIGLMPQTIAIKKGFSQVLWLFGENKQVTEAGTMNFFVFWINKNGEKELITAPLDGTILPGVTRDSIIQICKQWGEFKVSESVYTIQDIIEAVKENRMIEAFGAGTAAIVAPCELIHFNGVDYKIPLDKENPKAQIGKLTERLANTVMSIQYGEIEHPWSVLVD